MLQNATPLRKSAPWPPNISHEPVFCTAPATENASLQILFKCPTPAMVFGNATKPSRFAHFWQGAQSLAPATRKTTSEPLRHLNFQKWSDAGVFCTFWLRNVLRATTACNFSSLIWPDGSAPAALASLLSTLRSHKSLEKHSVSRLSYLFAHLHLLSSDSFSSLICSLLLFSSLCLCPALLFICPYCRKFDF